MGMRMPETCWYVFKWQVIYLRSCCIWLVDSVESGNEPPGSILWLVEKGFCSLDLVYVVHKWTNGYRKLRTCILLLGLDSISMLWGGKWKLPHTRTARRNFQVWSQLGLPIIWHKHYVCLFLTREPPVGQGVRIHMDSRSHTTTHRSRWVISSSQSPLPHKTQHSQRINIHAPVWFEPTVSASERP
jgi:hypothetical protein